jgi:hypothetical protein
VRRSWARRRMPTVGGDSGFCWRPKTACMQTPCPRLGQPWLHGQAAAPVSGELRMSSARWFCVIKRKRMSTG